MRYADTSAGSHELDNMLSGMEESEEGEGFGIPGQMAVGTVGSYIYSNISTQDENATEFTAPTGVSRIDLTKEPGMVTNEGLSSVSPGSLSPIINVEGKKMSLSARIAYVMENGQPFCNHCENYFTPTNLTKVACTYCGCGRPNDDHGLGQGDFLGIDMDLEHVEGATAGDIDAGHNIVKEEVRAASKYAIPVYNLPPNIVGEGAGTSAAPPTSTSTPTPPTPSPSDNGLQGTDAPGYHGQTDTSSAPASTPAAPAAPRPTFSPSKPYSPNLKVIGPGPDKTTARPTEPPVPGNEAIQKSIARPAEPGVPQSAGSQGPSIARPKQPGVPQSAGNPGSFVSKPPANNSGAVGPAGPDAPKSVNPESMFSRAPGTMPTNKTTQTPNLTSRHDLGGRKDSMDTDLAQDVREGIGPDASDKSEQNPNAKDTPNWTSGTIGPAGPVGGGAVNPGSFMSRAPKGVAGPVGPQPAPNLSKPKILSASVKENIDPRTASIMGMFKQASDSELYYMGYNDAMAGKPLDEDLALLSDDYYNGYEDRKFYNKTPQESVGQKLYDIKPNSNAIPRPGMMTPEQKDAGPLQLTDGIGHATAKRLAKKLPFPTDVVDKFFEV